MVTLNFKILPNRRKASNKLGIYLAVSHKKETRYITTEFEIDDTFQFEKDELKLFFDVDAREYNGRWYNSFKAWKVEKVNESPLQTVQNISDNDSNRSLSTEYVRRLYSLTRTYIEYMGYEADKVLKIVEKPDGVLRDIDALV